MKINLVATIGGILMIFSIFFPWILSETKWFQVTGNLRDLSQKSLEELKSYNLDDFKTRKSHQSLGIIMCFFSLLVGGILALIQIKQCTQAAAALGVIGLFLYTWLTLDFLKEIPYDILGSGYYFAWIATVLTGIGSEHREW